MAKRETSLIVADLTSEIGVDASYYRKDPNKLYLSGIEIAIILGTGVFSSFLLGLVKGIKKGAEKHGEQLGEKLVDTLAERLLGIRDKVKAIDGSNPAHVQRVKAYQKELDEVVNRPEIEALGADESEELVQFELLEIVAYLREAGYPPDRIEERATRLAVLIRRRWREN